MILDKEFEYFYLLLAKNIFLCFIIHDINKQEKNMHIQKISSYSFQNYNFKNIKKDKPNNIVNYSTNLVSFGATPIMLELEPTLDKKKRNLFYKQPIAKIDAEFPIITDSSTLIINAPAKMTIPNLHEELQNTKVITSSFGIGDVIRAYSPYGSDCDRTVCIGLFGVQDITDYLENHKAINKVFGESFGKGHKRLVRDIYMIPKGYMDVPHMTISTIDGRYWYDNEGLLYRFDETGWNNMGNPLNFSQALPKRKIYFKPGTKDIVKIENYPPFICAKPFRIDTYDESNGKIKKSAYYDYDFNSKNWDPIHRETRYYKTTN